MNQQVLSREVLDTLPTGNDLWSIGRIVPSVLVQAYDVGGDNSVQQPNALGARQWRRRKQIHDRRHGREPRQRLRQLERLVFRHLHVHRGELWYGEQLRRDGPGRRRLQHDIEDRHQRFHGSFRIMGTNELPSIQQSEPGDAGTLLEGVPPRVLAVSPNPRNGIVSIVDSGLSLSGPIVRNRLWFTTTGKLNPLSDVRLGSYEPDGTQMIGNNRMRNASFKLRSRRTRTASSTSATTRTRKGK